MKFQFFILFLMSVLISGSGTYDLLQRLAGRCQFDIVQYDVVTIATLPHTAVVLYATI